MADTLTKALMAARYGAGDNTYGQIGSAITGNSDLLMKAAGDSTSKQVLYGLGSTLLGALMNNYAEKEAAKENAELYRSANRFGSLDIDERTALLAEEPRLADYAMEYESIERDARARDAIERKERAYSLSDSLTKSLIDRGMYAEPDLATGGFEVKDLGIGQMVDPEIAKTVAIENIKHQNRVAEMERKMELEQELRGNIQGFESPIEAEKYVDTLRKELSGQRAAKDFQTASKGMVSVTKALNDNSAVSDLEFVYGAIQAIEPGMAVKEGEQAAVAGSTSLPAQLKGSMLKAITGEGALTPQTRLQIQQLVARRYGEHRQQFIKARDGYAGRASRLTGLDSPEVSFLNDPGSADEIMKMVQESRGGGDTTTPTNVMINPSTGEKVGLVGNKWVRID